MNMQSNLSKKTKEKAQDTENWHYQEFRKFFDYIPHGKLDLYWEQFRIWHKKQLNDEFSRFRDYMDSSLKVPEDFKIVFPNARKGSPYEFVVRIPDNIWAMHILNLRELNLKYERLKDEPHHYKIYGIPNFSGEYKIRILFMPKVCLHYVRQKRDISPFAIEKHYSLTINPDPKELWKTIPAPRDMEYFKPETDSASLKFGNSFMIAASVRGRSHAHNGLARDDDFRLDCINGWRILAVADGAGSARFSRRGSQLACAEVIEHCRKSPQELSELDRVLSRLQDDSASLQKARMFAYKVLAGAFFNVFKILENEAGNKNRDIKEYATTLLVAMAKPYRAGWVIISFQVGDGAMAMFYDNTKVSLLAEPDEGEFGGQTRFVTMKDIFRDGTAINSRLHINYVSTLDALLLMTDGVSDAKFETLANLRNPEYWFNLLEEIYPLAKVPNARNKLLDWLGFWSQGNHDDRTIAMLINHTPALLPSQG